MLTTLLLSTALAAPMSDVRFVDFLSSYTSLEPDAVLDGLQALSPDQRQYLSVWSGLGAHIFTRACHSARAEALVFESPAGAQDCAALLADEALMVKWGLITSTAQLVDIQYLEVINLLACAAGRIDDGSCSAGQLIGGGASALPAQSGGCTERYDSENRFLGCW